MSDFEQLEGGPSYKTGVEMLANREFLEGLIQLCPDGIIGVDRAGTVIIFNQAAENLTGLGHDSVVGKVSITQVYQPPELARAIKKKLYSQEQGGVGILEGIEVYVKGAGGRKVPIRLSAALLHKDGQEIGSVGFFHDLTARKQLEEELRKHSITDSLTGIYNRRHFHEVLSDEVERSGRYGRPLALAVFDLDHFKPFNDTFGHQEGDNILRLVGECMRSTLRSLDRAFRVGGDEFAFLMVETDLTQGTQALERFRNAFNQQWPRRMSYLQTSLSAVTMSIGVAELLKDEKPDKLLLRADLAMYEAKKDGGNLTVRAGARIGLQNNSQQ
jgi:diguanylate cyclase (GGDEF)-like protein/PAS domain S-box-containing protein